MENIDWSTLTKEEFENILKNCFEYMDRDIITAVICNTLVYGDIKLLVEDLQQKNKLVEL